MRAPHPTSSIGPAAQHNTRRASTTRSTACAILPPASTDGVTRVRPDRSPANPGTSSLAPSQSCSANPSQTAHTPGGTPTFPPMTATAMSAPTKPACGKSRGNSLALKTSPRSFTTSSAPPATNSPGFPPRSHQHPPPQPAAKHPTSRLTSPAQPGEAAQLPYVSPGAAPAPATPPSTRSDTRPLPKRQPCHLGAPASAGPANNCQPPPPRGHT